MLRISDLKIKLTEVNFCQLKYLVKEAKYFYFCVVKATLGTVYRRPY